MMHRLTATLGLTLLSACGGGGGDAGSTPPPAQTVLTITADNQERVTRTALGAVSFSLNASSLGGGDALRGGSAAPTQRALAVSTENVPCPQGGRIVISADDVNNNNTVDAGDRLTTDFQSCADADGVTTGRLVATVREASNVLFSSRIVLGVQLQSLLVVAPNGDREGGSGEMTVTATADGTGTSAILVEAARLDLSGRLAGTDYSHTVTQLRVQSQTETRSVPSRTRLSASAQIASSSFGGLSVSVETQPEFVLLDTDDFPSSGAALVRGAGGSQLRLTAVNAQQGRLELDANGDGVFEASRTLPWSQLGF
jgi:hypothetical protein